MKIQVDLNEHSYPIWIQENAIHHIDEIVDVQRKICIIADSGIPTKWIDIVSAQCPNSFVIRFEQGESSKCFRVFESLLEKCIEHHMNRKDAIIAIGGGVTGDLAGFVAATYMRGIDFYNIPTTLLAQVDSSVGGKVAIDVDSYKNIVGAFHQPKGVIIDPAVLSTLPKRQIHNGLVEALKTGLIQDKVLFSLFEQDKLDIQTIIERSILVKRNIVSQDEKESGLRQILNFGHTIGHAIESAYGLNTYLHGECVAMGMPFFIEDQNVLARVQNIYSKLELPVLPQYNVDTLMDCIAHDKKSSADSVTVVTVKEIGSCSLEKMSYEQIRQRLEEKV